LTPSYVGAAPVFRLYAVLTLGRVAAFGSLIVAAGRPGYVFRAALLSLAANILISVPALWLLGFVGPALGTTLAFIPTAIVYTWFIARATGVPLRRTFPIATYGRTLLLASVAGAVAAVWKHLVALPPAAALASEGFIVLAVFALVGTVSGIITRDDWRFAVSWIPGTSGWQSPSVDSPFVPPGTAV
jgi:O-antigen/teichoic acid export membrane protein